ncbi:MAG: DUF302 domain-containing protein [Anaerolineae bacterium]|nr:DUF302 domain-containing protein [Anaerolineae bacterium]MDW8070636.1 DUF302 domain-containing protein [Anaerolineae bacterium]
MDELQANELRIWLPVSFDQAVERAKEALKREGFGVLTEIDVQATLKKKLDADFRKYVILGACNPPLAYRAFQAELEIGLLMPCNVIVYEEGTGSVVSIMDPALMGKWLDNPELLSLSQEARAKLERVIGMLRADMQGTTA